MSEQAKQRNIIFIINPHSGTSGKKQVVSLIEKIAVDFRECQYRICYTEYAGHATIIVKEQITEADVFVAVGGDGTVNEVGKALIGVLDKSMGILPMGSGNGLARHLKIPLDIPAAITTVFSGETFRMDTGTCNGHVFLNVCGVGLEGWVVQEFQNNKQRGLKGYVQVVLRCLRKFNPFQATVKTEKGDTSYRKVWSFNFCNIDQYGNEFYISPLAKANDGIFNLMVVTNLSFISLLRYVLKAFSGDVRSLKNVQEVEIENCRVELEEEIPVQVDGEFIGTSASLEVKMVPSSFNVIVPKSLLEVNK